MAKAQGAKDLEKPLKGIAYTRPDGFLPYCRDIMGLKKLYPPFHDSMAQYVTGYIRPKNSKKIPSKRHQYRMVLAFRGSYKSTFCSISHPSREIARDFADNDYQFCNIRIGLASERMKLARAHIRAVKRVLESPKFCALWGHHRSDTRFEGGQWSNDAILSQYQDNLAVKDPTCMAFALGFEATGFHFNQIVGDDVQAYESSFSRDQLDKSWELYSLFHSLLDPDGDLLLAGTRWNGDDIYNRIMEQSKLGEEEFHFKTSIMPIQDKDGRPTFPTEFPEKVIQNKRMHSGPNVFASQYMLKPIMDEDRIFKEANLNYLDPIVEDGLRKKTTRNVMTCDPAWLSDDEARRGKATTKAYTVIQTWAVDAAYNFYLRDSFRAQCDRETLCKELWRQWIRWEPTCVGMQQVDFTKVYDSFNRQAILTGIFPRFEWIHSPSKRSKDDRIQGSLEGLWSEKKIYLMRGMGWLEEEYLEFPDSKTKDGLDAMVNAVKVAAAPKEAVKEIVKDETTKDIEEALYGEEYETNWENAY